MSNVFTLESLREAAEKKFGGVKIELDETRTIRLRNLFQLSKDEKSEILNKIDEMETIREEAEAAEDYEKRSAAGELEDGEEKPETREDAVEEMFAIMRQIIKIAADSHGAALVRELAHDDTVSATLFEEWMKSAQVGEAEHSPKS